MKGYQYESFLYCSNQHLFQCNKWMQVFVFNYDWCTRLRAFKLAKMHQSEVKSVKWNAWSIFVSQAREVFNQVVSPLHKILHSLTKYSCLVRGGGTESYEPDLRRAREATSNDKKIPPQVKFTWQKHCYKTNNLTKILDVGFLKK